MQRVLVLFLALARSSRNSQAKNRSELAQEVDGMSGTDQRVKINGEWRDVTREDIKNFFRNGIGRAERFRVIKSAIQPGARPHQYGRGKGKKRKPWELR